MHSSQMPDIVYELFNHQATTYVMEVNAILQDNHLLESDAKGPRRRACVRGSESLRPYVELLDATSGIVCPCLSFCKNRFGTMHFLDKRRLLALVS